MKSVGHGSESGWGRKPAATKPLGPRLELGGYGWSVTEVLLGGGRVTPPPQLQRLPPLRRSLGGRDALEGKGPQRVPQKRRRWEEVAEAVGGGYFRLQLPQRLALGVRETAAGRRLGALDGGGVPPPLPMQPGGLGGVGMPPRWTAVGSRRRPSPLPLIRSMTPLPPWVAVPIGLSPPNALPPPLPAGVRAHRHRTHQLTTSPGLWGLENWGNGGKWGGSGGGMGGESKKMGVNGGEWGEMGWGDGGNSGHCTRDVGCGGLWRGVEWEENGRKTPILHSLSHCSGGRRCSPQFPFVQLRSPPSPAHKCLPLTDTLHHRRLVRLLVPGLSPPPPPCDIPSGCCSFTGPWTVTRSSLRMLRRVAAFCRPLRPVLLRVSFPRLRTPPPQNQIGPLGGGGGLLLSPFFQHNLLGEERGEGAGQPLKRPLPQARGQAGRGGGGGQGALLGSVSIRRRPPSWPQKWALPRPRRPAGGVQFA